MKHIEAANCEWCRWRKKGPYQYPIITPKRLLPEADTHTAHDSSVFRNVVECGHPASFSPVRLVNKAFLECEEYEPSLRTKVARLFGLRKPIPKPVGKEGESFL